MATTLLCLALAVFTEARGEPIHGQEAVAHVVLNRAAIRDMEVCDVITEKGQFTWNTARYLSKIRTKAGRYRYVVKTKALPIAQKGWGVAMAVAVRVLQRKDNMQNVEFFHAKTVNPGWDTRLKRLFVAGNHIFYARKDRILASL